MSERTGAAGEREIAGKRFVRVAAIQDVPVGTIKAVEVDGEPVALLNLDGSLYAVHDECTHECFPLSEGNLQNGELVCLLHGARFDVRTGAVLGPPAYEPVKTYEVRVDGNDIMVAIER